MQPSHGWLGERCCPAVTGGGAVRAAGVRSPRLRHARPGRQRQHHRHPQQRLHQVPEDLRDQDPEDQPGQAQGQEGRPSRSPAARLDPTTGRGDTHPRRRPQVQGRQEERAGQGSGPRHRARSRSPPRSAARRSSSPTSPAGRSPATASGSTLTIKKLKLTGAAAKQLNKKLGYAKGKPKPFLAGKLIGKAELGKPAEHGGGASGQQRSSSTPARRCSAKLKNVEVERRRLIAPTHRLGDRPFTVADHRRHDRTDRDGRSRDEQPAG